MLTHNKDHSYLLDFFKVVKKNHIYVHWDTFAFLSKTPFLFSTVVVSLILKLQSVVQELGSPRIWMLSFESKRPFLRYTCIYSSSDRKMWLPNISAILSASQL